MPIAMPIGEADLAYAVSKMEGHKDVVISRVRIEVFDLLDPEQRAKCTEVEKDLLNKVYAGIVTVSSDKTDKMQRSDGSTTWMRLLKWVEYTLED